MDIKTTTDLQKLIDKLIKTKNINNKEDLFLIIREKTLEFYISKGELLKSYFSNLYFIFRDIKIEENKTISKQINLLNSYFDKVSLEEKFVISNYLFRLELLNGNFDNAIKEYLKRWLVLDIYNYDSFNAEARDFALFFDTNRVEPDILMNAFKEVIEVDYFFNLDQKTRRTIFVNSLMVLWNDPNLFASRKWLEVFDNLVELLNSAISKELIEDQMYIHFFTYHVYGNSVQSLSEWREFSKRVEEPASRFYKEWTIKQKLPKCKTEVSKNKKHIGIAVDRMIWNSPNMVIYSLIENLISSGYFNKNYKIFLYSMEYIDKQEDHKDVINAFLKLGIKFYSPVEFKKDGFYYSHYEKALALRDRMILDQIDYLINGTGYDISNFLFSTRTAPKQIYWSHGNCASKIENIDLRISHFEQECKDNEWIMFNEPISKRFLVGSKDEKIEAQKVKEEYLEKFGKDCVILGTLGRYIKLDSDEYIEIISKIMKKYPNTIYLACGVGNDENIKKKIKKYKIDENRFILLGAVNPHVYGWAIDIYPDTFPLGGGQSVNEIINKNKPVIFHKKRGEITEYCTFDTDEYIGIIGKLIENIGEDFYKEFVQKEFELWHKHKYKNRGFIDIIREI